MQQQWPSPASSKFPSAWNDIILQKNYLDIQLPMSASASSTPPGPMVTQFSVQLVFHTKISALNSSGN